MTLRRFTMVIAALPLVLGLSVVPFVLPPGGSPKRADAVIVLSGDHGERLARGLELMRRGVSRTLVLDGTPDMQEVLDLCARPQPFEVVCLRPDPDSTRHEARAAGRLAADRGWRSVVVVTTTHHVARAGMLFRRCFTGTVETVGATPPYGWRKSARQVVHEWLGTAAALTVRRGC